VFLLFHRLIQTTRIIVVKKNTHEELQQMVFHSRLAAARMPVSDIRSGMMTRMKGTDAQQGEFEEMW
jgi:hypothetical protein